jgi:PIN domain nuclease of toxin-antitoxin system
MRLLLDTHIWIWSVMAPDKLSKKVALALSNPANELWLSPVSVWELSVLVEKRRLELSEDFDVWITKALGQAMFREAPLTNDVALEVHRIPFTHSDPADHFIAATARVFALTLVTADLRLLALEKHGIAVLKNA